MNTLFKDTSVATPDHLANLDVLRALAVSAVVLHHTKAITGYSFPFLGDLGGLLGVQLFFLISGYLITESASKHSFSEYLLHRIFRIFPAYWVVYIGFGVMQGMFIRGNNDWFFLLLNLLNLQQLSPKALIEYDIIHVSWSLTVEMFWYALAPFVVLGGRKLVIWNLIGWVFVSTTWGYLASKGVLDVFYANGFAELSHKAEAGQVQIVINNAFPSQMVFFLIGASLHYYKDKLLTTNTTLLNLLVVGFILLSEIYVPKLSGPSFITGIGVFAFFVLILRARPSQDWLLIRIGKISYSIYLIHFSIILFVFGKFGHYSKAIVIPFAFLMIFLLANVLYEVIEKPFFRIGRTIASRLTNRPEVLRRKSLFSRVD